MCHVVLRDSLFGIFLPAMSFEMIDRVEPINRVSNYIDIQSGLFKNLVPKDLVANLPV